MRTIVCQSVSDARRYVVDTLGDFVDDFDVDAIVDEAFERTEDGWAIDDEDDGYWDIVQANAR